MYPHEGLVVTLHSYPAPPLRGERSENMRRITV